MFSAESHGIINAITLKLKIIDMVVTMKIGEFAKKYDIPISTVRYYIDENLITPKKNGAQYDFSKYNEFEMQILVDLRESAFSLEEMRIKAI